MKRLSILLSMVVLLWLGKVPLLPAQSYQAGVNQFRTPVPAPDFTLKELGGGELSLKDLRGKVVILNFYTTW